jgi:argininosuccinate lyase
VFTVEEMNKLVLSGIPLRDAYKKIASDINENTFSHDQHLKHTHIGSIGNLQNESIAQTMSKIISRFNFAKMNEALQRLLD